MSRDAFNHWIPIPTRWGDMDAFGHINNVQFVRFVESGRVRYMTDVLQQPARAKGESIILADIGVSFRAQVHWPSTLDVGTRVTHLGNTSMKLVTEMYLEGTDTLVAEGRAVVVWFDFDAQKPARIPDAVREIIRNFEAVPPT